MSPLFWLLWLTGLFFSLRLLLSALLFPGKTVGPVSCLSLSIVHVSSHLTCLLLLFSAMQLLSVQLGRAEDSGQPVSALPPGGSLAWTTTIDIFWQRIFLNTELLEKIGKMIFYHTDDFWPSQRSLFGTDLSKSFTLQWGKACSDLMHDAISGAGGCCRFLTNHLLHCIFSERSRLSLK